MAITSIPQAGRRGIDSRDTFVTKQEAFQDALHNVFVDEINTAITDINTKHSQVSVDAAQVSSDKASVAVMHTEVLGVASALPDGVVNDSTITLVDTWSSSKISNAINSTTLNGITELNISANHVLNSIKSTTYYVNASVPFLEITLPDVTTIANGTIIRFRKHASSSPFIIRDNSGSLIVSVALNKGDALLTLVDNSTSAGLWTVGSIGTSTSDISNSFINSVNIIQSAHISPSVCGVKYNADGKLLISSTDKIGSFFTSSSIIDSVPTITGNKGYLGLIKTISCAISKSSTEVIVFSLQASQNICTYSIDSTTGSASNIKTHDIIPASSSTPSAVLLDTNTVLLSSGYELYVVDITDSSNITIGTPVTISGSAGIHNIAVESSTTAMLTYKHTDTYYKAVMLTISGTSITFGTPVQIGSIVVANSIETSLCFIDTGKYVLSYKGTDTYAYAVVLSVSSGVITVNTPAVLSGTTATNMTNVIRNSTSQCIVVYNNSTTALSARVLSISGTTISINSSSNIITSGVSTTVGNVINMVSSNTYIITYNNNISKHITVSGTSLTYGAAYTSNMLGMSAILNHIVSSSSIMQIGISTNATAINLSCIANGITITGTTLSNGAVQKVVMPSKYSSYCAHQIVYDSVNAYSLVISLTGATNYWSIAKVDHSGEVHSVVNFALVSQALTDARLVKLGTNKYMIIGFSSSYVYSAVVDISGSSITIGTFYQSALYSSIVSMHACSYDATRGIVIISYSGNTSVIMIKETSGVISYGSPYSSGVSAGSYISVINTSYGVLALIGSNYSKLLSVSDTTLSVLNSVVSEAVTNTNEYSEFQSGFLSTIINGNSITSYKYFTFNGTSTIFTGYGSSGFPYGSAPDYKGINIAGNINYYFTLSYKESTSWI